MRLSVALTLLSVLALDVEAKDLQGGRLVRATIPTTGCRSIDMTGDQPPPAMPKTLTMSLPIEAVGRVAVYRSAWKFGVVGPVGWTCEARSGSTGVALYVAPPGTDLDADAWSGPIIALHLIEGETSGRFDVAAIAARVFPSAAPFARRVKAEGIEGREIAFVPFRRDDITHVSERAVLFRTPASLRGLGTEVDLEPGRSDIRGVVVLSGKISAPNISMLSVRLPAINAALYPAVLAGVIPARYIFAGKVPRPSAPQAPQNLESFD